MQDEPVNEWELGTEKEMQESARRSRKQPMTAERLGEYVGGFIGVLIAIVVSVFFFLVFERIKIFWIIAVFASCLFGGALVGKQVAVAIKKKPQTPAQ